MFRGNFFSVRVILVLVLIGLILFYVGGMVCLAGINNEKYDYDEYDDRQDDSLGAGNVYKAGLIILFVGALLSHIGLFAGGIANKELNPTVRVAMISMGIALLILIVILILFGPVMRATVGPF
jgi:hypothetical protein